MRWFSAACVLCTGLTAGFALGACRSSSSETLDNPAAEPASAKAAWSLVCNFDTVAPGTVPTGFSPRSGDWSVVDDPTAPSPTHALGQIGKSGENAFNLVVMDDVKQSDVELAVKMKAVAGDTDQGGGLAWRISDPKNYYLARFNPLERNFRIYKVIDGERKQLQSASVQVTPGWHELRVTMRGDTIKASIDGHGTVTARDTSFSAAGKVGLWTKSDAQTRFDDLKIGDVH
jgi:hypothetical protein